MNLFKQTESIKQSIRQMMDGLGVAMFCRLTNNNRPYNKFIRRVLQSLQVTAVLCFTILLSVQLTFAQNSADEFKIARVQYQGGGDWYSSPTALTNLLEFAKERIPINVSTQYDDVQLGSRDIHNYPFIYMTGHGNITVNNTEMENLRNYLENGGFLYVDDDYGFDQYVRPILENIFTDENLIELPASHPIYSLIYTFPDGRPPKVHEHDGKPPQAFALYRKGRMVVLYTYESNPADGWAYDEHDNPQEITNAALRFGVNLITYVFTHP